MKKRIFVDDGWAVWIEGEDTSTVYLNEWLNPKGKSYVDIGIRIKEVKQSQKLSLYIPFSVSVEEIEDISEKLHNRDILCAIFSAGCLIDYKKNEYTSEIAYNGKTIDLIHCRKALLSVTPLSSGTLIVIPLSEIQEYIANNEAYLLFRVLHKSFNTALKAKNTVRNSLERFRDLLLSPVLSTRYGYSVRINEMRMLPGEVTRVGAFHRQKLNKAVITISVNEAYDMNDSNCYRIRKLEEGLYRDYVPDGFSCENVLTYQWNQTREENLRGHFDFYFDISESTLKKGSMLIYMLLLILIGAAGSALWSALLYLFGIG